MNNLNLHSITNHFQDVRLVSLSSWQQAKEFMPRDKAGPYVVLQEAYDPADMKMTPTEFIIGRSGKWLPLAYFYKLPIPDRREEFIFGTAAEVMRMMADLPSRAEIIGNSKGSDAPPTDAPDEMAQAIEAGRSAK